MLKVGRRLLLQHDYYFGHRRHGHDHIVAFITIVATGEVLVLVIAVNCHLSISNSFIQIGLDCDL